MTARLSLCYAAPGHALLSTSGPTRNILSLVEALSQWADVTVAFRSVRESIKSEKFNIITIEPAAEVGLRSADDVALRGLNPLPHFAYLRLLNDFAQQHAETYDIVLEKGWRLSGALLAAFRRQGVPGMLIENDVRFWSEASGGPRVLAKRLLHSVSQFFAGYYSRQASLVVAETDELKAMLIQQHRIPASHIEVVGLGVDHSLFRPLPQSPARQRLGFNPAATILLYVGGMDVYHDLVPILEALAQISLPSVELHLVGDGIRRTLYENTASNARIPVRFHGHLPHALIPEFIAAADLCLAPYQANAFYNGLVTFSTLKIPEYMACGRPVVSIPSGHIQRLIQAQVTGFLLPNTPRSWVTFLSALPSRRQLEAMGRAAAQAVASVSWERTAARYLEIGQRLVVT